MCAPTVMFLSAPSRVAEQVSRIRLAALLLGGRRYGAGSESDVGRLGDQLVAFYSSRENRAWDIPYKYLTICSVSFPPSLTVLHIETAQRHSLNPIGNSSTHLGSQRFPNVSWVVRAIRWRAAGWIESTEADPVGCTWRWKRPHCRGICAGWPARRPHSSTWRHHYCMRCCKRWPIHPHLRGLASWLP